MEIFKVQVSLMTTEEKPQVLFYNRTRTEQGICDADEQILDAMKNRAKAFFYGRVNSDDELELQHEADWQSW